MKKDAIVKKIGNNLYKLIMRVKTGTFRKIVYIENGVGLKNYDGNINPKPSPPPIPPTPTGSDYLCFTAEKAGSTLRMVGSVNANNTHTLPSLEYSTDDGETWNTWNFTDGEVSDGAYSMISDTLTFGSIGDKVLVRGNCTEGTSIFDEDGSTQTDGFSFAFCGSESSLSVDNIFALSGDLQTLVDGTGETKTAPCFLGLFSGENNILITSAPDLTATRLSVASYVNLFYGQYLLTTPALMGNITSDSLPENLEIGALSAMYAETGITTMPSLPNLVLNKNTTVQDFIYTYINLAYIVSDARAVAITSDNGRTFNGLSGIDLSSEAIDHYTNIIQDLGGDIFSAFLFAMVLGTTKGFVTAEYLAADMGGGSAEITTEHDGDHDSGKVWIKDGISEQVTFTAHPSENFVKWQTSSDKGGTWTDDTEHLTYTFTIDAVPNGEYYYQAIFE